MANSISSDCSDTFEHQREKQWLHSSPMLRQAICPFSSSPQVQLSTYSVPFVKSLMYFAKVLILVGLSKYLLSF
jgi:hypothetical protein